MGWCVWQMRGSLRRTEPGDTNGLEWLASARCGKDQTRSGGWRGCASTRAAGGGPFSEHTRLPPRLPPIPRVARHSRSRLQARGSQRQQLLTLQSPSCRTGGGGGSRSPLRNLRSARGDRGDWPLLHSAGYLQISRGHLGMSRRPLEPPRTAAVPLAVGPHRDCRGIWCPMTGGAWSCHLIHRLARTQQVALFTCGSPSTSEAWRSHLHCIISVLVEIPHQRGPPLS